MPNSGPQLIKDKKRRGTSADRRSHGRLAGIVAHAAHAVDRDCTGYAVWMYQTWLPAYLEMQQRISIAKTGFLASIPLPCSILGAWSGGWFTDRLNARGMDLLASRRLPRSSDCCCRGCSP